ncbi:hypothetical protein Poly41_24630 [Novipirellula artificiosorum]|uniref:Uncharacterized protein n=1 Tax=Novipirellula artificiosorum TaxID=2528016 RepID=A0A5C6DS56_9BACT|nr:hypothetical protein Poly41_24630 [Novipirellula artificiosorum]
MEQVLDSPSKLLRCRILAFRFFTTSQRGRDQARRGRAVVQQVEKTDRQQTKDSDRVLAISLYVANR